ncbi:MAG: hypothetical protein ABI592_06095 [Acidobacteriota bacterium]
MKRSAVAGLTALALALGGAALAPRGAPSAAPAAPSGGASPAFGGTVFAPGAVSTAMDEIGATFTPDGNTVYFARRSPTTSSPPVQAIFVSRRNGSRWSPPVIVPFSGRWSDFAPSVSRDGSRLFFSSLRPRAGASAAREDADIWFVERDAAGAWGEPRNPGAPVNTDRNDSNACAAADGTLYFASDRESSLGIDLWRAAWTGSGWAAPENLGEGVNTPAYESQPAVAADQSFVVFTSVGRPDIALTGGSPYARGDLYVSLRRGSAFEPARNLGPIVNTPATESNPSLSPDGRTLYFTSERGIARIPMAGGLTREGFENAMRGIENGRGNIYEISLEKLGLAAGRAR